MKKSVVDCLLEGDVDMTSSSAHQSLRQRQALEEAADSFHKAADHGYMASPMEIVALELKTGIDALGGILGESFDEEVLDSIFSQFCLGK